MIYALAFFTFVYFLFEFVCSFKRKIIERQSVMGFLFSHPLLAKLLSIVLFIVPVLCLSFKEGLVSGLLTVSFLWLFCRSIIVGVLIEDGYRIPKKTSSIQCNS